ncbi:phage baseplate assembly protein [Neisseria sp. Ec49-e6-T10]|uniref:phage baseplate assembly protein n=1 Tax=Neisseria sp. Ec49-e6-T10 TaxID=3140744 RepID=UPI003EBC2CDD
MPTQDNEIIGLLVDGQLHQHWSSYEIDSDLLTPADGFQLVLGVPSGKTIPDIITEGAKIEVRTGEDIILTGRIDDITTQTDKNGRRLTVRGRDGAAVLLDCSAPIFNAQNLSLQQILDKLVKPLGITKIRIDADKTAVTNKVQIEPGERAWDALIKYAEANGVWPWFEPDGTLVVGGPDYTLEPVADLVMRFDGSNNNIEKITVTRSMARRYSEVTVLGQSHKGTSNIKATVKDDGVLVYRPLTVTDGDIDSVAEAQKRARKIIADSRLDGLTVEVTVKGYRTTEEILWTPGQRINLVSEPDGLEDVFFLMARTFSLSETGAPRTVLTLKEDGAWVLDARPSKAKKQNGKKGRRKGRKGRGKKGQGEVAIVDLSNK